MELKDVVIRKCGIKDLETLVEMRLEFLREAGHIKDGEDVSGISNETRESIETGLNKDLHMWLAEIDKKAVASGAVYIWNKLPIHSGMGNSSKTGYVLNMYTRKEYRRNGIVTSILQHIIQFLREQGITKVMLHALEAGKGVYKKFGFSSNESFMEMKI